MPILVTAVLRPGAPALAAALIVAAALAAPPARAQWTRAEAVPANVFYAVFATGDTVVAGADSVVWTSVDGGASWSASAPVGAPPAATDAVWFRHGRLWAGTSGQGVFTSDDLGASWQPRSDGLAGGLFNSHLWLLSFAERGDSLYAGTGGAGVFVRPLDGSGPWHPTGSQLVANQSGGVEDLAVHVGRMLAAGGANGTVHRNEGGAPWIQMFLDNNGLQPGLAVFAAEWTGGSWLVGTDHGFYRSADGAGAWSFAGLNLGSTLDSRLASAGGRTFACVNRTSGGVFRWTRDDGLTWNAMETIPSWASELALQGNRLWAARADGLWYRDVATLDAPPPAPRAGALAVRGAHPVRGGEAIVGFGLAAGGEVRLEVFDVSGRRVRATELALPSGNHEVALDVRNLAPGVYLARLLAPGRNESLRFARLD